MSVLVRESAADVGPTETNRIVQEALRRSRQIATVPAVTARIIQLTEDPDATIDDLKRVIDSDPALGVRILKLANSAYYGMAGQVTSINRALPLLGLKAVKNIAIAVSLVKQFRSGLVGADFDARELWIHSIAVAIGAQRLAARSRRATADEAFLAGLIHDAGILVEMQACAPQFAQVTQKIAADERRTFRQTEHEVLGASHEDFGAGLCQAWNFPIGLQRVTGFHHRPWELVEADSGMSTLVHIADVLAARTGLGYTRTVESHEIDPELLASVNLTEADLDDVAELLPEALKESDMLLSDGA